VLHEVALAVRARQVSVETLVRAALERIERHDFALNAVVALRAEEALAEARAVDEQVARDEPLGPLAGIPLLVKDIEDVAGMVTTHGSLLHADDPPASSDGLVPGRLRSAGAIVVGKTNVPEFAFEGYTANRVFGVTRNPWGHDWSPGGSSGGSAAAMMAGMAPIATASDGGGSIRIPSAACGLVGLKPTNGIVGRRPIPAWIDLSTDGPFATTVADLRLLLSLEAGPVAGDPSALPRWEPGPDRLPSRVLAAPRTVPWGPLPAAVESAFRAALRRLETDLGLPVEPIEPEAIFRSGNIDDDWMLLCGVEHAHLLGRAAIARERDRFDPRFLEWMDESLAVPIDDYMAVRRRRFDYCRELDLLLGDDAVLATPTIAVEGFLADGRMSGKERPGLHISTFNTSAQNITGHPAISIPAGTLPNGLPFGLQLTAPRFRDELLLAAAEAWERAAPWPRAAPGYEPFDAALG